MNAISYTPTLAVCSITSEGGIEQFQSIKFSIWTMQDKASSNDVFHSTVRKNLVWKDLDFLEVRLFKSQDW